MAKVKFTAAAISRVWSKTAPGTRRELSFDAGFRGLTVRLSGRSERYAHGTASFSHLFRVGGKQVRHTLKPDFFNPAELTGAALEEIASQYDLNRADLRKEIDPSARGRAIRAAGIARQTVGAVFAEYLDRYLINQRQARPIHISQTRGRVEKYLLTTWSSRDSAIVCGGWADRDITTITAADLLRVLDGIGRDGHKTQANRVFSSAAALFRWSHKKQIIAAYPFGSLDKPHREQPRERCPTAEELGIFLRVARELPAPTGPWLQLLVATGLRRSTAATLLWSEVDPNTGDLLIPAAKQKNGKAFLVPSSPLIAEALSRCPEIAGNGYIFANSAAGCIAGWTRVKAQIDAAIRQHCETHNLPTIPAWTFHDLRRGLASHLGPLGVSRDDRSRLLSHSDQSVIARHYDVGDYRQEKARALRLWSDFLVRQRDPGSNVTPLRRA